MTTNQPYRHVVEPPIRATNSFDAQAALHLSLTTPSSTIRRPGSGSRATQAFVTTWTGSSSVPHRH
jgi:hypothetical protein